MTLSGWDQCLFLVKFICLFLIAASYIIYCLDSSYDKGNEKTGGISFLLLRFKQVIFFFTLFLSGDYVLANKYLHRYFSQLHRQFPEVSAAWAEELQSKRTHPTSWEAWQGVWHVLKGCYPSASLMDINFLRCLLWTRNNLTNVVGLRERHCLSLPYGILYFIFMH